MHILTAKLTFTAVRCQAVVVDVAVVAPGANDVWRAPAYTAHGVAESVEGTNVAIALPAARGHVPVALDTRGAVTTGEQRGAGTLTGRTIALNRSAAEKRTIAR